MNTIKKAAIYMSFLLLLTLAACGTENKTDGTFTFSSGAADSGIGKMIFSGTEYSITEQACSQSEYNPENEWSIQYFVNGEPCSEDAFHDVVNSQEQKTDVNWHEFSKDNINAVF